MDLRTSTNLQGNEGEQQQVYIIQLDSNIQFDSQTIPLILDNGINEDLILPLLQQKHGPPLQLFIDPASTELIREYKNTQTLQELTQDLAETKPVVPVVINKSVDVTVGENSLLSKESNLSSIKQEVVVTGVTKGSDKDSEINVNGNVTSEQPVRQNIKNFVHIYDVKAPPRAIAVIPTPLQIRGKWISPKRTLSSRIRFGPVQGIRKTITKLEAKKLLSQTKTPVFLLNQDEEHVIHIDMTDKDKSNWIGLLPLGEMSTVTTLSTANVWLYEDSNELYCLTLRPIKARIPLRLGYSKKYVEDHNIPPGPPALDLDTVSSVQWWCNECNQSFTSSALLQRHTEVDHKDEVKSRWPSYRCKHCRRSFGRLFTLRRHLLRCPRKIEKSQEKSQNPSEAIPEPDISSALEDNRIPSDESFHNFTNSLDFSTNLFDTDRIAGLDISGHSRADSDLNPYSIGFKDENGLSNDLGFTKLTTAPENIQSIEMTQVKKEPTLEICAYCNQVVVQENKGKHLRQCPSRLICECGRVFRHKKSLAVHIHKNHPSEKSVTKEPNKPDKPKEDKDMPYHCQDCQINFKRRGMLVNHLWRIHKIISTMPVERKVRHYPCVVCPKIYTTSAKRNRHVKVHHPEAEIPGAQSIEGGVKSLQPASCSECPRQYATRAKLLQHVRSHHPHLAKTLKKQEIEKKTERNKNLNKQTETIGNQPFDCNNFSIKTK